MKSLFPWLVVVVGCGGKILEEPPDAQAPPVVVTPSPELALNPFNAGDDWQGTYTCAQGLTQLDLRIVATHDNVIDDALFDFDFVAGRATGSFHLKGTFDPSTGTAVFKPTSWVEKPGSNWLTVGMTGQADAISFAGKIDGVQCSSFSVKKI